MTDCIFCKIAQKQIPAEIYYEDDHIMAFKDIHPKAKIHWLVIPKEHIVSLATLEPQHQDLMGKMVLSMPKLAKQAGLKGFKTWIHTGRDGGQEVDHLHFHLLGNP